MNPNNLSTVLLRFDSIPPVSSSVSPSTASAAPLPVSFNSSDSGAASTPPTGSGVGWNNLWFRRDRNGDGNFSAWQLIATSVPAAGAAASTGTFSFNPVAFDTSTPDGDYQFYTQAVDVAGNFEPPPLSTSAPKAETYFDDSPPVIANVAVPIVMPTSALVQWNTDDASTGWVDYGTTTAFGYRVKANTPGSSQQVSLNCMLLFPATIYYRVTAVNRTQLVSVSSTGAFATPIKIQVQTDIFGVVTTTAPIVVQTNNFSLSSGAYSLDGSYGTLSLATTGLFQIALSTTLSGPQTLTVNFGGFDGQAQFIVDLATRSAKLARLVMDGAGLMTSTAATPGSWLLDASLGEAAVGPPSDQYLAGYMGSGYSRLYAGYYAGIDPVAPGAVTNLAASAGPGQGRVTLSWTAPGDDAYVGQAMLYDLRYASHPITNASFLQAASVALSTYPAPAGSFQQAVAAGLADATTYYFALRALDELYNAGPASNSPSALTFVVAKSSELTNGRPTVELLSFVSSVTINQVSTTTTNPALALATSAAAAQGLLFASPVYDILSPVNPLPGGATVQFAFDPAGLDPATQQQLRIYHFIASSDTWVLLADAAPDLTQDLLTAPVYSFSYFAVMAKDRVPPVTTLLWRGGRQYISPAAQVFASTATQFVFSALDPPLGRIPGSGVAFTRYRLDSSVGPFTTLVSTQPPLQLPAGLHELDYQSADRAGNVEPLRSAAIAIDGAPPVPRFATQAGPIVSLSSGIAVASTGTAAIAVSLADPLVAGGPVGQGAGVSTVSFSVDGGSFALAGSSFTLVLSTGIHALALVAQDNVGNVLDLSTSPLRLIVGDILPPRTTLGIGQPQASSGPAGAPYVAAATSFTLSSIDDAAAIGDASGLGVAFQSLSIDGVARSSFTNPAPARGQIFSSSVTLAGLPDGLHALSYFAQDTSGNREAARVSTVALDATAPITTLVLSSPSFSSFVSSLTTIAVVSTDPAVNQVASGVALTRYRVGTSTFVSVPSTFSLTGADGPYLVQFQSQDRVNNLELLKSATIFLDDTSPVSALSIGLPQYVLPSGSLLVGPQTPFLVVSTDPLTNGVASGVRDSFMALDSGAFQLVSGTFTVSGPDGPRAIRFYSRDQVLNAEPAKSTGVVLDATPPLASLLSPSPGEGGVRMVFSGRVPVIGTVSDLNFQGYVLDYAPGADATMGFTLINASTVAVSSGTLGVWNTFGLSGFQTLRLTATDLVDNVAVATVTVYIGSPALLMSLQGRHGFNKPSGVAVDAANRIYVADTNNDQVDVFTSTGGFVAILGRGDGATGDPDDRTQARLRLNKPKDVKVDAAGNVYIADANDNRVVKVTLSGRLLLQIGRRRGDEGRKDHDDDSDAAEMAQPGHGNGQFNKPSGVALDAAGRIYVSDTNNHRVQIFAPDGSFVSSFGLPAVVAPAQPEPNDPDPAALGQPFGISLDGAGNIYVADAHGDRILKFSPQGVLLRSLGSSGSGPGQFLRPEGVAVDSDGGCLYASDRNNDRVQRFDFAGNVTLVFGSSATFNEPVGLALDNAGDLFIADRNNNRVLKYGAPAAVPQAPVIVNVSSFIQGLVRARGGGRLDRGDRVSVIIPDGALSQDWTISIQPDPSDPATLMLKNQKAQQKGMVAISSSVDYGPEGTTFNKPVTITLAYAPDDLRSGVDPGSLAVFYWNPQTADWEALPSVVNQASMTVSAQTSHFSLYGILGAAAKPQAVASNTVATIQVACNPMRPAIGCEPMRFQGLPAGASLRIYTFTGALVKSLSADGSGTAAWDGTNQSGAPAASGVYFVFAQGAGATKTIKVAVQR